MFWNEVLETNFWMLTGCVFVYMVIMEVNYHGETFFMYSEGGKTTLVDVLVEVYKVFGYILCTKSWCLGIRFWRRFFGR